MNPNAQFRRAHAPANVAGEAVPLGRPGFKAINAALRDYLRRKGDVHPWRRPRVGNDDDPSSGTDA